MMIKSQEEKKSPDKFITIQHVAECLSCSDRYVSELIKAGALNAIKIGPRAIRVSENSLIKFIKDQNVNPQTYSVPEKSPPQVARSRWVS